MFFEGWYNQRSTSYQDRNEPILDLRRAQSLRAPLVSSFFESGSEDTELSSFSLAGSTLESAASHVPPPASRHPLFSHHARTPKPLQTSPSCLSDPGPAGPPSPADLAVSIEAFSPASTFLSHFSSSSLFPVSPAVLPDGPGARVLDYTLGRLLGRGGFSTVRLATHVITGETFACKIVKRDDLSDRSGSLERFEEEVRVWQGLPRHPSLLPLISMHRTSFATFLIMPYFPGGSLLDMLRREGGSERTASKWFPGIVAAISALHEGFEGFDGEILHGDLKLENFLVDQAGHVTICDFYMAQKINHALPTIPPLMGKHSTLPTHLLRGPRKSSPLPMGHGQDTSAFPSASLPYAPPELIRALPSRPSLAQDIWALGIVLYALLTGKLPFVDAFDPRLQMKILRGTWDQPADLSQHWIECLRGCLDGNKESRWHIKNVRECDAVKGCGEVKPRSKTRSRSRTRRKASNPPMFELTRQVDVGPSLAQPVAITPHRPHSRGVSVRPILAGHSVEDISRLTPTASGSRSRSGGQDVADVFDHTSDLTPLNETMVNIERMTIDRGRSTTKKSDMPTTEHQYYSYDGATHGSRYRSESSSRLPSSSFNSSTSSPQTKASRGRSKATAIESGSRSRASLARETNGIIERDHVQGEILNL